MSGILSNLIATWTAWKWMNFWQVPADSTFCIHLDVHVKDEKTHHSLSVSKIYTILQNKRMCQCVSGDPDHQRQTLNFSKEETKNPSRNEGCEKVGFEPGTP